MSSPFLPKTYIAKNTYSPNDPISDADAKEFLMTMIEELRVLAEQAHFHALSRQMDAALKELRSDTRGLKKRTRLLC